MLTYFLPGGLLARQGRLHWPVALALLVLAGLSPARAVASVAPVQHASKDAGVTSSSSLAFPANNTAGNWIGVVIRAGHSGQVFTVSDVRGNTYRQAVQFNQTLDAPNGETLAIYYAESIAGGTNTVTVSESIANNTLRFAILEYSGVAASNSLDVTAAAQGSGTALNSGNATTTASGDLVLGAVATADGVTYTAGSGYTIEERVPAAPNTKLVAEDEIQAVAGVVSVSATLSSSNNGGALLAAFKAAGGTLPPSITSLTPNSGPVGTSVTIAGANFGASQGTSTATFNGVSAGTAGSWSASSITVNVPSGATTGNVIVTVGGQASNGLSFTVTPPPPSITSLTPNNGPVGTSVTIAGTNFGASQGTSTVTFNGVSAGTAVTWSASSITVNVPTGATTGNVVVTVGGVASNGVAFTVTPPPPSIANLNPPSGPIGSLVIITGTNFGVAQGTSTVTFNGASAGAASSWSATSIGVLVPAAATTGNVVVTVGGVASNGLTFAIGPDVTPPAAPSNLVAGASPGLGIQLSWTLSTDNVGVANYLLERCQGVGCNNFTQDPPLPGNVTPFLTTGPLSPSTSYSFRMRARDTAGNLSGYSNIASATTDSLGITNLNPSSGPVGTAVTVFGGGFGATQGTSTVTFNGTAGSPTNWSDISITVPVPAGATSGNVIVTVGGGASNGISFTVTPPSSTIASLSPSSGPVGSLVIITGTNFGSTQGTSTVTFNGVSAGIAASWSPTNIGLSVPTAATTGNVVVTVGGVASNGVIFTVGPDVTPPTAPTSLTVTSTAGVQVALSWTASTDNVAVTGYLVERCQGASCANFVQIDSIAANALPRDWDSNVSPGGSYSYRVRATDGAGNLSAYSNVISASIPPGPDILSLTPTSAPVGASITIAGTGFGTLQGTSTVTFHGVSATPTSWSDTSIAVAVPPGAATGALIVTVGGTTSNSPTFFVVPNIASLNPANGLVGAPVTIAGSGFGVTQLTSTVTFNGTAATPTSWSDTSIVVPVPTGATTGNVVVTVNGVASNGVNFTVNTTPVLIKLVQHASKDAGTTSPTSLAFPTANTAGNWIAVVIRGGKSGQLFAVSDSLHNSYHTATQFNVTADTPNGDTLAIFYAENIAGGANTVTVANSISGNTIRFAILEYSGVALTNSLDVAATGQGTSAAAATGNVITTANADLLLGAVMTGGPATFTVGTGYKAEELVPAEPNSKLLVEDQIQAAAGSAWAGATLAASDHWGAVLGAFRAAAGGGTPAPTLTNLNPNSGAVGTAIIITGTNFSATQGTSTVTFNGVSAGTAGSWSATSITVNVPTGATTGNVIVTVGGQASNGLSFTVTPPPPSISTLTPNNGPIGTLVTIAGTNFGSAQGTSTVTFNGVSAGTAGSWSTTSITVNVPTGATTGNVVVTVGGTASNGVAFTVTSTAPSITSLNPTNGPVGTSVTVTGTNFGSTQGISTVTFNGTSATPTSWSATSIAVPVPAGATTGNVVVTVGGVASNGASFTVTVPNSSGITLVQHTSKDAGVSASSSLAFASNNTAGNFIGVVIRGGKASQVFTVTDSRGNTYKQAVQANLTVDGETIAIYYAENITGGANTVTVSESITNNTLRFAILEYSGVAPSGSLDVTAFAQGSDTEPGTSNATTTAVGDLLIAEMTNGAGTTFGAGSGFTAEEVVPAAPNSKLLVEDGIQALPGVVSGTASMAGLDNWGALLAAFRPATGSAGPHIVSVSPGTAPAGALVTIAGTNFGAAQGSSSVAFNGAAATPRSWSNTNILVQVPAGATSGNVIVTVGGTPSNGMNFNVGFAPPISFVQVNSSQNIEAPLPSSLQFVTVPFKGAQTTGNLNVVVVGWLDSTTTISSVTDTAGNVYTLAVGPTILSGTASQAIYYAKDILPSPPNTNIVTVTFSKYATNADMRIAEYAGLDPLSPFDVGVAGQGSGATSNSGSVSTTNANDLLVGANVVSARSTAAGVGFTSRVISPSGGILEDRIVAATGSYSATATLNSGSWIMQMAAFKAPSAAAPAISIAVSPTTPSTPTGYGAQNFTAILQNDVQRLGVTWTLSGSGCSGITCGSLSNATSASVSYAAPANVPSPAAVTLTATSIADPTKAASAIITVTQGTLNVAIRPKRAAVTMTQVQQFNAIVTNDPPNAGVVWSVDGNNGGNSTSGTISSTGLFTPGTQAGVHTVTATSVSNASVNVSATIGVTDFAGAFSYHYDPQSTGQNTREYALTPATVNSSTFGLLFSCPVDGFMFASPIYVPGLIFGAQQRNVVFIATEHNSVYAFDADSPACTQLWHTSFLSSGVTPVSPNDTGDGVSLVTEFGITSTPVIDPATNTIYVVANTKEIVGSGCSATAPCYFYKLHALDLVTGAEKFGGPVVVTAPNFNALFHLQRPGLLLNNGAVYVAFGSHADLNTWQGWVMAYNAATLTQNYAWSSTVPTGGNNQGAIWGSGNPPVADASGNVYVVTGNGTWDGTQNYSDSVVKLRSTGSVSDYFTPFNQGTLSVNDIDLGSAGAVILPDSAGSALHPHLLVATGKVGVLYLLDQTNLGQFHSGVNLDVQEVNVGFNTTVGDNGFFAQPAYWNGNLYTVMTADSLRQFPISNGVITNPASSVASKIYPYRGATPSASSSGITNGIVWVLDITEYQSNGPAVLDAYDASHVATILYSSPVSGAGAACSTSKFTVPVVANGKVYVSGSNCFSVFGLLPD